MPREKRPLSEEDALDVEATCRAVKRLQIAATEASTTKCNETVQDVSNPEAARAEDAAAIMKCMQAATPSTSLAGAAFKEDQSKDRLDADSVLQSEQPALTPLRSPPQRSLSSPDMSRFKFRLTLSKPPIHPTSSGKIRRQLSLTDSIDDDGALSKTTSDRHCEQERLFHQLDQSVLISDVPRLAVPSQATVWQPRATPVSQSESQLAHQSRKLPTSGHSPSASMQQQPTVKHDTLSALGNLVVHGHAAVLPDSNSDDVCQPSTPIRREDSIPVHADEQQLIGEAVFAALYEQTNVLLRNLHFERVQRRASTS